MFRNMKASLLRHSFECIAILLLSIPFFTTTPAYAQKQTDRQTVSGRVLDQDGTPIPGVAVFVKGTNSGVTTSSDGTYSITANADDELVFSSLGYSEKTIAVGSGGIVNVTLESEAIGLDETIVIGYGTQSRRTITSAVAKVSGDVMKNNPVTTVGDALKGRIAGARVYTDNFTPGTDATITIRGGSSINGSNAPLVLVDGIERPMGGLNPSDIESIEVLKDAASTAIYGSRASNGIILITTKSGSQSTKPAITFESTVGLQGPETLYPLMNSEDYLTYVRPAANNKKFAPNLALDGKSCSSVNSPSSIYSSRYLNDGETIPAGYKSMADPLDPTKTLIFEDNDWQRVFYRTTVYQNYYLNVTGGNQSNSYLASVGYTDDDGVALGTGFKRLATKLNLKTDITDRLHFRGNVDFSYTQDQRISDYRNNIARSLYSAPTMKLYFEDGTPTWGINETATSPLYYFYIHNRHNNTTRISLYGGLTYDITKYLKADVQLSYFIHNNQNGDFENANHYSEARATSENYSEYKNRKLEAFLNYKRTVSNHSFDIIGGYSYLYTNNFSFGAASEGGSTDKIRTLTAGPTKTKAVSDLSDECLIGYFGRLNYDYAKKYLFSVSFRADGSSRFTKGHQWGYFPAASVGWIVSEEPFLQGSRGLSFLKLRASYGMTGNNAIGLYDALGAYATSKYYGQAAMVPSAMPNDDLTWETTTQTDLGLELGLFSNRVMINYDYFRKITDNLLFSVTLPNTSGFSSVMSNTGKVLFHGFDLEVSTKNINRKNFKWDSKFTWSFVKNMVLELPDNGMDKNRIGGIMVGDGSSFGGIAEGEPMFGFYGYVVDHILQNAEEAANARYDTGSKGLDPETGKNNTGKKYAGDYEWKNREGSSTRKVGGVDVEQINEEDQFLLGYLVPHSTGGFGNTFTIGNFMMNLYLDWALGHSIMNMNEGYTFTNHMTCDTAINEKVKTCWTGEGDTNAKYARFCTTDPQQSGNFNRVSDVFTYRGDYLCIREVSLGYNLPKSVLQHLRMQSASIVLSGNNLHYFTAVPGVSPEVGSGDNFDHSYGGAYPPMRKVSVGVKVTF